MKQSTWIEVQGHLLKAKQVLERHVTRGERTFAAGTADITAAGRDGKKTERK